MTVFYLINALIGAFLLAYLGLIMLFDRKSYKRKRSQPFFWLLLYLHSLITLCVFYTRDAHPIILVILVGPVIAWYINSVSAYAHLNRRKSKAGYYDYYHS
ncbi:hypothetical protein A2368_00250 [Candidatus Collierbacteria bacterium RIFOXYB1_FULL_49_13]|uniref:Uncharacterized protein n=1 Tax=Candidatus Collierbacteria bacterium RIFOXYB1_FULL_49_13 TaxID=1817728 RepID=A0A1F5FFJ3_9BACT|nr:MAG: hypothetical protein A2368_00250 [Candidatus Collierbacteria bacterium RIFOXYB1_FULL_49_13]